jgi:uncharacterized protein
MKQLFVDTNAWIALNSSRDQFHKQAVELNQRLLKQGYRYLTTNFVLDESYTGLLVHVRHATAVEFGEKIRHSRLTTVIHVTEQLEDLAWNLFKQYADKTFSFTDCTSFVVMQQLGLTDIFTNDHHFEQMGFTALLKL